MSIAIELTRARPHPGRTATAPHPPSTPSAWACSPIALDGDAGRRRRRTPASPTGLDPAFLAGQGFTGKPGQTVGGAGSPTGGVLVARRAGPVRRRGPSPPTARRPPALARAASRHTPPRRPTCSTPRPEHLARPDVGPGASAEGDRSSAPTATPRSSPTPSPAASSRSPVVGKGGRRVAGRPRAGPRRRRRGVLRPRPGQHSRVGRSRRPCSPSEPQNGPAAAGLRPRRGPREGRHLGPRSELGGLLAVNRGFDRATPTGEADLRTCVSQWVTTPWRWSARGSRSTRAACR